VAIGCGPDSIFTVINHCQHSIAQLFQGVLQVLPDYPIVFDHQNGRYIYIQC
jgi:hypothetical protein